MRAQITGLRSFFPPPVLVKQLWLHPLNFAMLYFCFNSPLLFLGSASRGWLCACCQFLTRMLWKMKTPIHI